MFTAAHGLEKCRPSWMAHHSTEALHVSPESEVPNQQGGVSHHVPSLNHSTHSWAAPYHVAGTSDNRRSGKARERPTCLSGVQWRGAQLTAEALPEQQDANWSVAVPRPPGGPEA